MVDRWYRLGVDGKVDCKRSFEANNTDMLVVPADGVGVRCHIACFGTPVICLHVRLS